MPNKNRIGAAAFAAIMAAGGGQAASVGIDSMVDWSTAIAVAVDLGEAGLIDPEIQIGINPQPEPPGMPVVTDMIGPYAASRTFSGVVDDKRFALFLAGGAPSGAAFSPPTLDGRNFPQLVIGFDIGSSTLDIVLDFASGSGGIGSGLDAVSFNPQPEPPALFGQPAASWGLEFGMTSYSDVTVTMSVLDENGDALRLSPAQVPLPATSPLLAAALVGAGAVMRKGRMHA